MDRFETFVSWIVVASMVLGICTSFTGCSGLGVKAEMYRIDDRQESSKTTGKPLKCLFVDCGGESHGS